MEENKLQIFNNPQFGQLRTLEIDGELWFAGKDVAVALGYAKPPSSMNPAFIPLLCPASCRLPSSLSAGLHLRYCPAFVKRAVTQTPMPHNLRRKAHDRNFSARVPRK